jgi:hypothetical protein
LLEDVEVVDEVLVLDLPVEVLELVLEVVLVDVEVVELVVEVVLVDVEVVELVVEVVLVDVEDVELVVVLPPFPDSAVLIKLRKLFQSLPSCIYVAGSVVK